jgi:hypothetical protein
MQEVPDAGAKPVFMPALVKDRKNALKCLFYRISCFYDFFYQKMSGGFHGKKYRSSRSPGTPHFILKIFVR